MSLIIMLIGAGAVGKSTISRLLIGEQVQESEVELEAVLKGVVQSCRERYTIGATMALAGSYKNGSDDIRATDALYQVIDLCWQQREVVLTDSVRCTCKLVEWVQNHSLQPAAIFVHVAPELKTNIERLFGRRAARGITEPHLPDKTFWNVFKFRARARMVWRYARTQYRRKPVRFLEITDGTPEQAVAKILEVLRELKNNDHETC
jgi:hypothetical protein